MNKSYMGIDPGIKGKVAVVSNDFVRVISFPLLENKEIDLYSLKMIFSQFSYVQRCFLEKVNAFPKQGVASSFNFGKIYGKIQGLLVGAGIPFELVHPIKWQNVMHAGMTGGTPKERSIEAAKKLFPHVDLRASQKCRVPDHNICDALLLAAYGQGRKPL